jgi:hypothetical protein
MSAPATKPDIKERFSTPSLHIKVGPMIISVMAMNKKGEGFQYM